MLYMNKILVNDVYFAMFPMFLDVLVAGLFHCVVTLCIFLPINTCLNFFEPFSDKMLFFLIGSSFRNV